MEGCIFCDILEGKTKTQFVFTNENLTVFRDIHPQAPVHLLIVPYKHIPSINRCEDDDRPILADMLLTGKKMAKDHHIDRSGYRLFFNVERGGGQMIFHIHLHLVGGWNQQFL